VPCGTAKTTDLASEKIGGFTGVFFGMYATGNGQPCDVPADFAWFEYNAE
jgi:xylan 1,4-beta-xylosidase